MIDPAAVSLESLECVTDAAVHRTPGRSKGHRLVSSPTRAAGLRRGNGRPLHPLLEHSHSAATAVYRHRLTSLQPGLVQTHQRTGTFILIN